MSFSVDPVEGLPEITPDRDLGADLAELLKEQSLPDGTVVAVAQKVVSKAEGRLFPLSDYQPGPMARRFAPEIQKDPRLVQAILDHSRRVVRMHEQVLITETTHGFVCANAGLDQSNVDAEEAVLALPEDPDDSALRLREALEEQTGNRLGVIVTDTWGRPWRQGQRNVTIGLSGRRALRDHRGREDDFGNELTETLIAEADELAGAAELVMGKSRRVPVALIRGLDPSGEEGKGTDLLRSREKDLFR